MGLYFVAKYEVGQQYGGPEEGGWYYDAGVPVEDWKVVSFTSEDDAYAYARIFNAKEAQRRDDENQYDYTSVLSYREEFFEYRVIEEYPPKPFPEVRPHYE